jgi:ribosomal protein S6
MLNQYETVFIMTPVLSDEQMKETVEKYQKFLISKGRRLFTRTIGVCENSPIPSRKNQPDFIT